MPININDASKILILLSIAVIGWSVQLKRGSPTMKKPDCPLRIVY